MAKSQDHDYKLLTHVHQDTNLMDQRYANVIPMANGQANSPHAQVRIVFFEAVNFV